MNLDSRVKDILYIADCFTVDTYKKYIGTECYMTDFIDRFRDLSLCKKAVLTRIADGLDTPYVSDGDYFRFCLASVFVEQKQTELRPFTLEEFNERFPVGQPIKFRGKGKVKDELYLILLGFRISQCNSKTIPYIYIGYIPFTLNELFDEYEWQETDTGVWMPFGVKE